jgi:hypothetical protein
MGSNNATSVASGEISLRFGDRLAGDKNIETSDARLFDDVGLEAGSSSSDSY